MTDRIMGRGSVRTAVVWDVLSAALAERSAAHARAGAATGPGAAGSPAVAGASAAGATPGGDDAAAGLDIVDVGGGTGGFAVRLAEAGHRVTVVDSSPDALAALGRRAAEFGVSGSVRAVQGDLGTLFDVVDPGTADAVLCHGVLEMVDDLPAACVDMAQVLRPGGICSVLVPNRTAAVVVRALGGHFGEARRLLDDPAGRYGDRDPVPRRFTETDLAASLAAAGLAVTAVHGVRIFADLVPGALVDGDGVADLIALEAAASARPEFRSIATQLHMLAERAG